MSSSVYPFEADSSSDLCPGCSLYLSLAQETSHFFSDIYLSLAREISSIPKGTSHMPSLPRLPIHPVQAVSSIHCPAAFSVYLLKDTITSSHITLSCSCLGTAPDFLMGKYYVIWHSNLSPPHPHLEPRADRRPDSQGRSTGNVCRSH